MYIPPPWSLVGNEAYDEWFFFLTVASHESYRLICWYVYSPPAPAHILKDTVKNLIVKASVELYALAVLLINPRRQAAYPFKVSIMSQEHTASSPFLV